MRQGSRGGRWRSDAPESSTGATRSGPSGTWWGRSWDSTPAISRTTTTSSSRCPNRSPARSSVSPRSRGQVRAARSGAAPARKQPDPARLTPADRSPGAPVEPAYGPRRAGARRLSGHAGLGAVPLVPFATGVATRVGQAAGQSAQPLRVLCTPAQWPGQELRRSRRTAVLPRGLARVVPLLQQGRTCRARPDRRRHPPRRGGSTRRRVGRSRRADPQRPDGDGRWTTG